MHAPLEGFHANAKDFNTALLSPKIFKNAKLGWRKRHCFPNPFQQDPIDAKGTVRVNGNGFISSGNNSIVSYSSAEGLPTLVYPCTELAALRKHIFVRLIHAINPL